MISTSQDEREAHAFDDAARDAVCRAIGERRDVRPGFLSAPLPPELITRLLATAHSAPSVGVMQPTQTTQGHGLGCQSIPETAIYFTVCAVQNLWLAARAEGVGVGWVSILSPQTLRSILNLRAHMIPITYLCRGHDEAFADKPELEQHGWERRLPLANVVSYETYGAGEEP